LGLFIEGLAWRRGQGLTRGGASGGQEGRRAGEGLWPEEEGEPDRRGCPVSKKEGERRVPIRRGEDLGHGPLLGQGLTRVNLTNVQDEGLRIGGIGRRMNSKVKISQTRHVLRINMVVDLACSRSPPDRPLLAPIYRWPCLKELVGSDTYYNIDT
jgi:hypothetical protein